MRRILALALGDIKNITRDPILIIAIFVPFFLAFLVRFGLPVTTVFLADKFSFSLTNYYQLIVGLALLITPLMIGLLFGFILLDERDEDLLLYFSITPLTKTGYIFYRLFVPILLTFILSYCVMLIQGVVSWNGLTFFPVAIMLSIEAPLVALLMATVAENKVEGLAFSKIINLLLLIPVIEYVFRGAWTKIAGIFPTYWPVLAFISSFSYSNLLWLYFVLGFIVHFLWLFFVIKRFKVIIG